MPFVKGYIQTKKHQKAAKKSRFIKFGKVACSICKKDINKYRKLQKTCGEKECRSESIRLRYEKLKKENPIASKALTLFSTIRLGKGKKETALRILKYALGNPCKHCGEIIDLNNASIDHKEPRLGSKVHNRKEKKMIYSPEEIRILDNPSNLTVICRNCNQTKGDMSEKQFILLLDFLNKNLDIKEKLFFRLKLTRVFFAKNK